MVDATCLNDDCEKGSWTLRKKPEEYKRGVTCPECGTTQVEIEGSGGEQAPARRAQAQEARPAPQQGSGGAGLADTLFVMTNFDEMPTDMRREAVSQGAGFLGGFLNRWLDNREASMRRNEQRAKNAQIEPIEEYPTCHTEGCNYQFGPEDLNGHEARCPRCDRLYSVELLDAAEA